MDDEQLVNLTPLKAGRLTNNLRYVESIKYFNAQTDDPVMQTRLQQQWLFDDGTTEWQDVPVVQEEENTK